MDTQQSPDSSASDVALVPLIGFRADWELVRYEFEPGLNLVRLSEKTLERMTGLLREHPQSSREEIVYLEDGVAALERNVEWALAIPWFSEATHIAPAKKRAEFEFTEFGDFSHHLRTACLDTFLTSLEIVGDIRTITPMVFRCRIDFEEQALSSLDSFDLSNFYEAFQDIAIIGVAFEPRRRGEEFGDSHLPILQDVWRGLIQLRHLAEWTDRTCSEAFFHNLDKDAGKRRLAFLAANPDADEDKANSVYKDAISKTFRRMHQENLATHTRLGRVLDMFRAGLRDRNRDHPQHAFVAMCTTLEALYVLETDAISHRLSTRAARLLGASASIEDRMAYFKRVRKVYKARSRLVHGESRFENIPKGVCEDAYRLVRQSLQAVLADDSILSLFSQKESDKRSLDQLRDFFTRLDLGDC